MDEEKNENIPYDPDINHIVDTTIWEEESYGFEEEERDHEELISSRPHLGQVSWSLAKWWKEWIVFFKQ